MTNEDYVSLEVAKKLREKGFNEHTPKVFHDGYIYDVPYCKYGNDVFSGNFYLMPTLYEAAKWLRKTHDIHIVVSPHYSRKYEIIEYEYRIATYFDFLEKPFKWRKSKEYYEIYEQCLNSAILAALELI